jgi:hypothetical protein
MATFQGEGVYELGRLKGKDVTTMLRTNWKKIEFMESESHDLCSRSWEHLLKFLGAKGPPQITSVSRLVSK